MKQHCNRKHCLCCEYWIKELKDLKKQLLKESNKSVEQSEKTIKDLKEKRDKIL